MKKIALFILGLMALLVSAKAQTQTDSLGVYALCGSSFEKIDVLNYQQTKVSSSIIRGKAKLAFAGSTSSHHFKNTATFRLYFGVPSPYEAAKYYMFTSAYSAKDFGVGKFKVKKDMRYLTAAMVSIIGHSSIGAEKDKDVKVETKKIRNNVYEITVTAPAGEYCIMPVINGIGGYAGVFDFTIE